MSTQQTFALCIDCWEFHYGIADKNGVYSRDSGSSNHWDHAVHVFGRPDTYPAPICNLLASLSAGLPISDGRIEMFSLACAIHAIQPTNGNRVAPPPELVEKVKKVAVSRGIEVPSLFDEAVHA